MENLAHPFTTTGPYFCQIIEKVYEELSLLEDQESYNWRSRTNLVQLVVCERPGNGEMNPWVKSKAIYAHANVMNNKHWVLAVISIPWESITLYDSLESSTAYPAIQKMATLFPIVLCKYVYNGLTPSTIVRNPLRYTTQRPCQNNRMGKYFSTYVSYIN